MSDDFGEASASDEGGEAVRGPPTSIRSRFFPFTLHNFEVVRNDDLVFGPMLPSDPPIPVLFVEVQRLFSGIPGEVYELSRNPLSGFAGQVEVCPDTGRLHVQGYFETKAQSRFETVHAYPFWSGDLWIRRARGSANANLEYVSKSESKWVSPEFPDGISLRLGIFCGKGQGKRSDLAALRNYLAEPGRSLRDVALHPDFFEAFLKYNRAIKEWLVIAGTPEYNEVRPVPRRAVVYHGLAGCGKTTAARQYLKDHVGSWYEVTLKKQSGTYFTGYAGQKGILMDEFDGYQMPLANLKAWLQGGPFLLNDFMGGLPCFATLIVFTSQKHPKRWYPGVFNSDPEEWAAIERRLDLVQYFEERRPEVNERINRWQLPPREVPLFEEEARRFSKRVRPGSEGVVPDAIDLSSAVVVDGASVLSYESLGDVPFRGSSVSVAPSFVRSSFN